MTTALKSAATCLTVMGLWLQVIPVGSVAWAFPEPTIVTKSWQYDFSHDPPRPIAVHGIGGQINWFWFMTYKVVNNTGDERLFVPEVTIFTNTGKIIPAGRNVPAAVFNVVQSRVENPLLESPAAIIGKILQGPDHAKEGVVIWPAPAPPEDVDQATLFFSGLSGETHAIKHPLTDKRMVLRKTLMIQYDLPGTTADIQDQPVVTKGKRWVMR